MLARCSLNFSFPTSNKNGGKPTSQPRALLSWADSQILKVIQDEMKQSMWESLSGQEGGLAPALTIVRLDKLEVCPTSKEKGRRLILLPRELFRKFNVLASGGSPGSPDAVAQHRQLHRPSSKSHCFAGTGRPDVDTPSADCAAGVGYNIFARIARVFQSHARTQW